MEKELISLCRKKRIDLTIRHDLKTDAFVLKFEKDNKVYERIFPRSELNTSEILPKTLAYMIVEEAETELNH